MRLWTLHPKHLDARGLVAVWREALLAQAVLRGRTRGYTRHPQLDRFRASPRPIASIAAYLRAIHEEAARRGYSFDEGRIARGGRKGEPDRISATRGQLRYEWRHLRDKLRRRDRAWLGRLRKVRRPDPHPLFRLGPGDAEAWERRRARERTRECPT
jgi:pyrimidine dimer DNA glycosylase